jgi:hypothetical protein
MALDKTSKIGGVLMDTSFSGGEEVLEDKSLDEITELVQKYTPADYNRLIEERKSWEYLYHLSPLRENLVEWLPMDKKTKVLEIGSECGALTGALSRKAGNVTCVELSEKKSLINAYRHKDSDNITIKVGKFSTIESTLDNDYDFILLIGSFDYAIKEYPGDTPYKTYLNVLKQHLSAQGRIMIAMDNKYGLKYFAGCKEDHTRSYFAGIENYDDGGSARTLGRGALEKIFYQSGFQKAKYYYPYPDYKFMTSIYSDAYLPSKGELSNNMRNFDNHRLVLFNERLAFNGIMEEGLFPIFSNSFFIVLGEDFPVKFVKYSNDRAEEFQVRTEIFLDLVEGRGVYKLPLSEKAQTHIRSMGAAYESLKERYRGGELEINRCTLTEREGKLCAAFTFEEGVPLSELMDQCLEKEDIEGFYKLFREFVRRVGFGEDYPVTDYDVIFANIMVKGNRWVLLDYEWTFANSVPIKELAFRAAYCYILEDEKRSKLDRNRLLQELSITEEEAQLYQEKEIEFQKFVTGNRKSMAHIRNLFGYQLIEPVKWLARHDDPVHVRRLQIYEDKGAGCSEENSYFVENAYQEDDSIEAELIVKDDVKVLRIDPCMDVCLVQVKELTWNGKPMSLRKKRIFQINGAIWKNSFLVFPTKDPNIHIRVDRLSHQGENHLYLKMEVVQMKEEISKELGESWKRFYEKRGKDR